MLAALFNPARLAQSNSKTSLWQGYGCTSEISNESNNGGVYPSSILEPNTHPGASQAK